MFVRHKWVAGSGSVIFRVLCIYYIPRQAATSTKAQTRYFTQAISWTSITAHPRSGTKPLTNPRISCRDTVVRSPG